MRGHLVDLHLTLESLQVVGGPRGCCLEQTGAVASHPLTTGCQCCSPLQEPAPTASEVCQALAPLHGPHRWTPSSWSLTGSCHSPNRTL